METEREEPLTFEDVQLGMQCMQRIMRRSPRTKMYKEDMTRWIPPFLRGICTEENRPLVEDFLKIFDNTDW